LNQVFLFHKIPSKEWFKNTLTTIKSIYNFVSIDDIESYYCENKRLNYSCHITFDDGDISVFSNAFPVLKEMNIPATLFVSPKVIKNGSNYWFQELIYLENTVGSLQIINTLSKVMKCSFKSINNFSLNSLFDSLKLKDIYRVIEEIKRKNNIECGKKFNITKDNLLEMHSCKLITVGSHSLNHPILANENDFDCENEIKESILQLSKMLGEPIKYFAYPNGITGIDYNNREKKILNENGIKLAFATNYGGFFKINTDQLGIARTGLSRGNKALIYSKIFFCPVWELLLNLIYRGKTDRNERKSICKTNVFSYE
jgi:peptidoglycan/xylan/chitin deacetylase (PgdA/CDA1 family)